ncbi:hypothetical protein M422DRAFT_45932 [Sphaerobolus stellatus SS14]|uniref:Uncharacterized protein n=1 Tax=Sphaerobolus stellatus (strain SS14) TaxID=990650 RepID=A0A0C9VVI7_SPHS4|nr:hypothetical protein M422DRAFT_45932 [Sphaerobolus stellatus SS14]
MLSHICLPLEMFRKSVAQTSVNRNKSDVEQFSQFDGFFDSSPHSCGTSSDASEDGRFLQTFQDEYYMLFLRLNIYFQSSIGSVDSHYNGAQHQYEDNQTGYIVGVIENHFYPASIEIQKKGQAITNW